MTIISVIDNGRLHLGYAQENQICKQLGRSINLYSHSVTQYLAKRQGKAENIIIAGRSYCVNSKSLAQHLSSIGLNQEEAKEMATVGYETFINLKKDKIYIGPNPLGENLSHKKRGKFFKRLIHELIANNTEAVKKLVRKGAYFDREFFVHDPINGKSLFIIESELEKILNKHFNETIYKSYTPLTMAVEKGNQPLSTFFYEAKNKNTSSDLRISKQFQRTHPQRRSTILQSLISASHWTTPHVSVEKVQVANKDGGELIFNLVKKKDFDVAQARNPAPVKAPENKTN